MTNTAENNKRIAKNTLLLYFRMLISVIVGLYTSRVVLNTLGVEDYGIYNVVGGIVAMFSFLNTSMSGATSRFLTYEMGKSISNQLNATFNSAMIIHIGIAIIILIIAETIGLWFLQNKLVIPEERMFAAHIVYQFSILSMTINVTQVPYNASIIAHEKMGVYAYVELLNVSLKLGIVFILLIGSFDKLILYAILIFIVTTIIAITYRIYCKKHFKECHINWKLHSNIIKPMISFSCWDLYGNMTVSIRQQGLTMLLNMFYGPILNAANGIAMNVHGIILGFANNVITAFRPQIIKQYAENNIQNMSTLVVNATKFTLCLYLLIAIPLFIEIDYVLKLWLKTVPEHTTFFLRIILICSFFKLGSNIINIPIHATGKIKKLSFISGSFFLLSIPILYILMKLDMGSDLSYCALIPIDLLIALVSTIIAKSLIKNLKIKEIFQHGYLLNIGLIICAGTGGYLIHTRFDAGLFRLILTTITSTLISINYIYFVLLSKKQKEIALKKIKIKLNSLQNGKN